MLTISDKCGKMLIGNLTLQQPYVDGKLIRQTGGFGTIDFIYGAGGAIGKLIGGPNGSSAATVLSKFLKYPIKKFVSEFAESLLSDFTNWYAKFVTEKTVVNSKKIGV